MFFTRVLCAAVFVVGCSSPSTDSTSAPISYGFDTLDTDVKVQVIANAGVERLVQGFFAMGHKDSIACSKSELVDGCQVFACTRGSVVLGTNIDAGAITATSNSFGESVPLTLDTGNGFARLLQPGDFPGGETVRVAATGSSSFPAFDLEVRVPSSVTPLSFGNCGREPTPRNSTTCTLSAEPVAKWSGGDPIVIVSIAPTMAVPEFTSLQCAFDGRKGEGEVPAAALSRLAGGVPQSVSISSAPSVARSGRIGVVANRVSRELLRPVLFPR